MSRIVTVRQFLSEQEGQAMLAKCQAFGFVHQFSSGTQRVMRKRCTFEDRDWTGQVGPGSFHTSLR